MIKYELRAGDPDGDPAARPAPMHAHGVYEDREEAQARLDALRDHIENQEPRPAKPPRNKAYWLHEIDTDQHWQIPPKPMPRDMYGQSWTQVPSKPGCWDVTDVEIAVKEEDMPRVVGRYHRDYPGRPPFEPFRQRRGDRWQPYALIAPHYEETAVIDLGSGDIVARFDEGFCPVGFYVPDWWDVHDGGVVPGSLYWEDPQDRWPDGTVGFVWGCMWGDDNGWKVQAVNLSQVHEGAVRLEERWGYLYLDNITKDPRDFIRVHQATGSRGPTVTFAVPRQYEIAGPLLHSGAGMYE